MNFGAFFHKIGSLISSTHLPEQIGNHDAAGLLTNPWFLVPVGALCLYMLYKKNIRDLIILVCIGGMWYVSGTEYMQTLVVNGEVQINKVLPVMFGGAVVLGIVIYLLISRSD